MTDRKNERYQIGTAENAGFLRDGAEKLLAFGHRFPAPDGSSYWLGDDGTPWMDRNRETWITCRMVHVYSIGCLLGHPESEALVDAGLRGLRGALKDPEHGGWYAAVTPDGRPVGPKQCYAHAFVMLAASSALLAKRPGAARLLDEARTVYDRYFWDAEAGLAADTWDTAFTQPDPYRGINANMHSAEAFLAIADVTEDPSYRERAGRIIRHVIEWAGANNWRIPEHFHSDWSVDLAYHADRKEDPFKPYGATPGHGIEWARLITQWALSTYGSGTGAAAPYLTAAQHLYRRAVSDAWNADGAPGIVYTTDWNGVPLVHDRMHWTLAEAINTSSVLWKVTGGKEYAEDYARFMQYLDETVKDPVNGSWFHQLDAANHPIDTVWPGKPDIYHALQAMLIPLYQPDLSIAKAVAFRRAV